MTETLRIQQDIKVRLLAVSSRESGLDSRHNSTDSIVLDVMRLDSEQVFLQHTQRTSFKLSGPAEC